MGKMSAAVVFIAGAAIGGLIAWRYAKAQYSYIAEQEIASVKETYARREQALKKEDISDSSADKTEPAQEKSYTDYSRTIEPRPAPNTAETPYVISPDEFGEIEEYAKVSLTYFADDILADEYGEVFDNVEEIIGDGLNHFGEYEDDSVFVRSDAKRCDYEILRDLRNFEEFLKTLPPKHGEED